MLHRILAMALTVVVTPWVANAAPPPPTPPADTAPTAVPSASAAPTTTTTTTTTTTATAPTPSPSTPTPSTTTPAPVTAAATRARVLLLDLEAQGTEPENARLITGVVASLAGECAGAELLTSADLRKVMELSAAQQTAGCTDSCLVELADSLGAEYIIYGDVGTLGASYVVSVSLFEAASGQAKARKSIEVSALDHMAQALRPVVGELLKPLGGIPAGAPSGGVSPMVVAGGATLGIAGAAAAGLGIASLIADGIASDPKNEVVDKEGAIGWGRITLVAAAAAGTVALVGAGLLVAGMAVEQ